MNREEAQKIREVFNAFCDGAEVQFSSNPSGKNFREASHPSFDSCYTWRVKPKEPREFWVNIYPGNMTDTVWPTEEIANNCAGTERVAGIQVREVMDDE